MTHTLEQVAADAMAERISYMLDNGWEILRVTKYAVTLKSRVGSHHTLVGTGPAL